MVQGLLRHLVDKINNNVGADHPLPDLFSRGMRTDGPWCPTGRRPARALHVVVRACGQPRREAWGCWSFRPCGPFPTTWCAQKCSATPITIGGGGDEHGPGVRRSVKIGTVAHPERVFLANRVDGGLHQRRPTSGTDPAAHPGAKGFDQCPVKKYLRERFFPHMWCPGCGHGIVLNGHAAGHPASWG